VLVVAAADGWVRVRAGGHRYRADSVPGAPVGIVFGAQVYPDGTPSPYLAARLDLGQELVRSGKVRALLLTGDFGTPSYDEPDAMRRYLEAHGVPGSKLVADYAGFDTYQSCARAYRVFGVRSAIIVTTDFSYARTVALCRSVGIDANGVVDTAQRHDLTYLRGWVRDQLADTKAAFDMVVRPDPKYLGHETSLTDAIETN
jgi:vancomycin permeability regulator SanA